jgi:hypothetical protein
MKGMYVPDQHSRQTPIQILEYQRNISMYALQLNAVLKAGIDVWLEYKGLSNDVAIVLTGSDGRSENMDPRNLELIVLVDGDIANLAEEFTTFIKGLLAGFTLETAHNNLVQVTNIHSSELISAVSYEFDSLYPDFILSSAFITGNEDVYKKAKQRVIQEMKLDVVRQQSVQQLKGYIEAAETEHYKNVRIFDTTEGYQIYKEGNGRSLGFKIPFLRALQRSLLLLISSNDSLLNLLLDSGPCNTANMLTLLHRNGFIDSSTYQALNEEYFWFLEQYHTARNYFGYDLEGTSSRILLEFDIETFERYSIQIIEFAKLVYSNESKE